MIMSERYNLQTSGLQILSFLIIELLHVLYVINIVVQFHLHNWVY